LGDARPAIESFARWSGIGSFPYDLVKRFWETDVYPRREETAVAFEAFWNKSVEAGFARVRPAASAVKPFDTAAVKPLGARATSATGIALVLYSKPAMPDGRHAYNPWLQELPDPVTKAVWDNYASLAPAAATRVGVRDGDVIRLELDGTVIEAPVLVQPGQNETTVALALGYGRSMSERFADTGPRWLHRRPTLGANGRVGVNAAPFLTLEGGFIRPRHGQVRITAASRRHPLAVTQDHHTLNVPKRGAVLAPLFRRPPPPLWATALHNMEAATGSPASSCGPPIIPSPATAGR
jgi:molybdopterin-containing oxidoreductase family iron-sulfur binding subunit